MSYLCEICGEQFSIEKEMKVHMIKDHGAATQITDNTHEYFQCEHCSKSIKGGLNLERHVRGYHKIKIHKCAQCSYKTNRAYNLIKHKETHMVKSTEDKQASIIHKKQHSLEHLCEECGELFSTAWTLQRHVKRTHKLSFKCDLCKFETEDKQASIIHKKQHTQEYYQCDQCNKTFPDRNKNDYRR